MKIGWVEVQFNNVLNIISGKNQKAVVDDNGRFPIYGSGGIIGYANDFICHEGTTIIGRKGTINSPIYVREKFWNVDTAFGLSPHSILNNRYLYFFCLSFNFKKLDKSTAVPSLAKRDLLKIIIPLAPLPEQRAIVSKIEALFSELDHGIANLKKAQDQLKVYRQAVLKKAFEGELTKAWRAKQKDLPSAEELLEQIEEERAAYYQQQLEDWKAAVKVWEEEGKVGKKPKKPKKSKELPPFDRNELDNLPHPPSKWEWVKVDKVAGFEPNSLKAGPFGSALKKSFYVPKGFKVYGQEQVISGDYKLGDYYVTQEKYEELSNCQIQPKDILISLVGTVGKVLVLPNDCEEGIINPRLVKITTNHLYFPKFFKAYFESAFLKSLYKHKNHGTTMDVLNLGIIKELPFPFCSLQEQQQIVQEIESRLSVCDQLEATIQESLDQAEALRQSILKKAFEGELLSAEELAACRKEADWEDAGVLLERIKAERGKKSKK
jgi:type I restriction enzyme S subunit